MVPLLLSLFLLSCSAYEWELKGGEDFRPLLKTNTSKDDMFYLFTADTQHPWRCSTEECKANVTKKDSDCLKAKKKDDPTYSNCVQKESLWTEETQQTGMRAVNALLEETVGKSVQGLVVNGDLTAYGHSWQMALFQKWWWPKLDNIKIWPGLGNHDYANNIHHCFNDQCSITMMDLMTETILPSLKPKSKDIRKVKQSFMKKYYEGSMAYSWDEGGIHFIQFHNYPTYETAENNWLRDYKIKSSLSWLRKDLEQNKLPVVLNQHDFTEHFRSDDKKKVYEVLSATKTYPLAWLFGHLHWKLGPVSSRDVPNIDGHKIGAYFVGSVPYNAFTLIQFGDGQIKNMFRFKATRTSAKVEVDRHHL